MDVTRYAVNTHGHPTVVVITPPSAGPMIADTPQTPENTPCIRARWREVKMSPAIVKEIGWTAPAPRPWSARNAMRVDIDVAVPQRTDPITNSASPTRNTGLRPWMSARRAKSGTVVVDVTRYAVNTHEYSDSPPSCPMIVGMAGPTTVESRAATAMAAMIPAVTISWSRVSGASRSLDVAGSILGVYEPSVDCCRLGDGAEPTWAGRLAYPARPIQSSTRSARSVFHRLGVPSPSSIWKWTAPA